MANKTLVHNWIEEVRIGYLRIISLRALDTEAMRSSGERQQTPGRHS